MWDKLDIRIPFDDLHVNELSLSKDGKRRGTVSVSKYDFPLFADIAFIDGQANITTDPQSKKWGTISSAISSVAVGFFPDGNGFYPWPHVSIKASPSKILQGHNVFGTENIRFGAMQMLATFKLAFPKIAAHLSFDDAEVCYLDATYSAHVGSEYQRNQIIRLFESLFPNKESISRYTGYMQANKNSEYFRQKFYYKLQELLADLDAAKRKGEKERAAILADQRLQDFAHGRMRFEATIGKRALERLGIPNKLNEFLKFHDWFETVHNQPLCQYLWGKAFNKLFSQVEGHTMKNTDDNSIKLKIESNFLKVKANGKVCKRKANAIYRTYRDIKQDGYDQLARENNSAFFRNVSELEKIGISRAFLKSLDPQKPNENVIPLIQLIRIDFSAQRPHWYKEPVAGFSDSRRQLRLVS